MRNYLKREPISEALAVFVVRAVSVTSTSTSSNDAVSSFHSKMASQSAVAIRFVIHRLLQTTSQPSSVNKHTEQVRCISVSNEMLLLRGESMTAISSNDTYSTK